MKRLPVVQSDEAYARNYATRKAIADADRAALEAAIAACGPGADAYGRHSIHDKLGIEPERVIYCCRRVDGEWDPPAPDLSDVRVLKRTAVFVTRGGIKYESSAVTIENTRFVPDPVTRFLYRYDVSTLQLSADYRPRTPEQMKAAAEARRAKAIAAQQADLEAKERELAARPQLVLDLGVADA